MKALSLYELNNIVRSVIESTMDNEYWLQAELSDVREAYNGHCYVEFVQKATKGSSLIAKAKGNIWANKWYAIRAYFEQTTGQPLSAGMQVLVKVNVTFHELYGYSLNVTDIDPTYTLGDIAKRRQEIMRQLKEEGIDTMNKELPLPRLLQRIAVISSANAAGYGDFCNQLNNNSSRLSFQVKLFAATMQGNSVESSIISALNSIAEETDNWDVVVIIRGGGATSDLSGFDTLDLAENVAQFPLPIITGIGHERDDTIIDMVAHTRVKTPTAAAEFLIHHQEEELVLVDYLCNIIISSTKLKIANSTTHLSKIIAKLPTLFSTFQNREEVRINRLLNLLDNKIGQHLQQKKHEVSHAEEMLKMQIKMMLNIQQSKLELIDKHFDSANPERILKLGFSITRINGRAITDASKLKKGDVIETEYAKGSTKATIN